MSWDASKSARRRGNSTVKGPQPKQPPVQPKSTHVADPFLLDFLSPSFDPAAYLNGSLPRVQPASASVRSGQQGLPLAEVSTQAQTLVSQLNTHTSRLSSTLTQLTDEILRSGGRLAYEVELLRGETLGLAETVDEALQEDIKQFVPEGLDATTTSDVKGTRTTTEEGDQPTDDVAEPEYITQLRTLTLVRSRLDSVIKTFGDAMEFVFPPSEVSVSSGFLSVSAPEPGAEQHSTEEKGQQVLQKLRDEILQLLSKSDDPIQGIEKAAQRIEELKDLTTVWKGTAEEKGRAKFIESLAKMVEDRHRDLLREMEQTSRRDTGSDAAKRTRTAATTTTDGDTKAHSAGYGFISQLQKMRSGLS